MKVFIIFYFCIVILLGIFSYGFIDLNLHLSSSPLFLTLHKPLETLVFYHRNISSVIYFILLSILFVFYIWCLKKSSNVFRSWNKLLIFLLSLSVLLLFSFPAFSYDIFNYMTTAKVVYTHHENPYIVMPIEISNDPNLAFTRASNKVALYGPTWLLLTYIPHTLGMGNIWQTIIAFKLMNIFWYFGFVFLLWRVTKNMENVIFFALNPLVIIETLVSGHNDIVMMTLACAGIVLWQKKELMSRCTGLILFILSVFVKGSTLILFPLFFLKKFKKEQILFAASVLLFAVFITIAPLREELYPWYAIWFLSVVAFLPYKIYPLVWQFSIVLSLGLELRHLPYMAMGYYGGLGPVFRILCTAVPIVIWSVWIVSKKRFVIQKYLLKK